MTGGPEADDRMMRYLLGELDPDEQAQLDERAFVDDAWEEERDTAADELIEAYLTGALRPDERQHFEVHFLASAAHRERFQMLRDLRTVLARRSVASAPTAAVRRSFVRAAAAAALLAALAALVLYARAPAPGPRIAVATPATPSITTPEPPPATATPRPLRGSALVTLPTEPRAVDLELGDVGSVRFQVPVSAEGPPSYAAVVRRDHETVWRRDDLVPAEAGAPLVVTVPADVLGDGVTFEVQPEAVRSASPAPSPRTRVWRLRIVRN